MKFYIKSNPRGETKNYTHSVLSQIAQHPEFGHSVVKHPANAEAILVSLCDITEIDMLEKTRQRYPEKTIVAGGPLATAYFKLCAIFADIVNIGQVFDFYECQAIEEARELDCTYTGTEKKVKSCTRIDWEKVPVAQVSKGSYYYWGGIGCKNKCKFCLTSWTNPWKRNSPMRIKKAAGQVPQGDLKVVSNQYHEAVEKVMVKDMLLRDYIKAGTEAHASYVRMGIEFATEERRRKMGKPASISEIIQATEKAAREQTHLIFFFIAGLDKREDWTHLFKNFPSTTETNPKIMCKFTNLEYQMHTPLFSQRKELDPDRYLDGSFGRGLFRMVNQFNKRLRIKTIKYPAHALWRMGQSLCTTEEEYFHWKALKGDKDLYKIYEQLFSTEVIDTDYSDMVDYGLGEGSEQTHATG